MCDMSDSEPCLRFVELRIENSEAKIEGNKLDGYVVTELIHEQEVEIIE